MTSEFTPDKLTEHPEPDITLLVTITPPIRMEPAEVREDTIDLLYAAGYKNVRAELPGD